MRLPLSFEAVAMFVAAVLGTAAHAAGYDESINGDIFDDRLSPTLVILDSGSNAVSGTFGRSPAPSIADLDCQAVTVPTGYRLEPLALLSLNPGGANSFLEVQAGAAFTIPLIPSPALAPPRQSSAEIPGA